MGIFNFGGAKPELKDEKEAYLAVIYAAIAADGVVEQEEVNTLLNYIANKAIFRGIDLKGAFKRIQQIHKESGSVEGIIAAAADKISNEYKPTVFASAVDFMLADGTVGKAEEKMLYDLKAAFGLSDELSTKIVDVIVLKNK